MEKTFKIEILERVEKALDTIRPYLETDGGNVKVVELNDKLELTLELLGSCGNCPMSTMTFRAGIEESIKKLVPEVTKVEATNLTLAQV